jgi:alginate biosynthesis protein AlgX
MSTTVKKPRYGASIGYAFLTSTLVMFALANSAAAAEVSSFECKNLEKASDLQLMEGRDGMFFRIIPDIKMYHPLTNSTIDYIAELSASLKAQGTTLIYVPVPTKSMILPDLLPPQAQQYGFNPVIANSVYDDVIARLKAKNVLAVDIAAPMRSDAKNKNGDLAFFRTDFHWTAQGARPAARQIAELLSAQPEFTGKPNLDNEPVELAAEKIPSTMRKIVQRYCNLAVPEAMAHPYEFKGEPAGIFADQPEGETTTDIFADSATKAIALVGTSFSDMTVSNFAGFIEHYTGMPVENYSIAGGNQFGSIISYMTSREFQENRPKYMIWENPIYNNLAQFGDAPLKELLASAANNCGQKLPFEKVDTKTVSVDISGLTLNGNEAFLADIGGDRGRKANFVFTYIDGQNRQRLIERGDRLRATGRYYLPLEDLAGEDFHKMSITFDADVDENTSVELCKIQAGDPAL